MQGTQLQFLSQDGFIDRLADNDIITQRITDGYINATAMCKAANKTWSDYVRLTGTKAFISELSSVLQISQDGLIQSIQGGVPHLHPNPERDQGRVYNNLCHLLTSPH